MLVHVHTAENLALDLHLIEHAEVAIVLNRHRLGTGRRLHHAALQNRRRTGFDHQRGNTGDRSDKRGGWFHGIYRHRCTGLHRDGRRAAHALERMGGQADPEVLASRNRHRLIQIVKQRGTGPREIGIDADGIDRLLQRVENVPKTETGPMLKSGNSGPSNSPACFPATCPAGSSARTAAGATAMQASKPERATAAAPRTIFENFMPSPSDYASKLSCSRRSNRTSRRVRKSHGSKISSSVSDVTVHSGSASRRARRSRPSTAA